MILAEFNTFIDYLADNRYQVRLFDADGLPLGIAATDEIALLIGQPQKAALLVLTQDETTDGKIEIVLTGEDEVEPAHIVLHMYASGTTKLKENNSYQGDLQLQDTVGGRVKQIAKIAFVVQPVVRFPVAPLLAIESNEIEPIPALDKVLRVRETVGELMQDGL